MTKTNIQWTDATWNPITGCTKVSPGCANCYAEKMSKRLKAMGQPKYQDVINGNGRFSGTIKFWPDALKIPLRRKKPTIYFVNSMSDLFHADVAYHWLDDIWSVMSRASQHTFQILTKRASLMHRVRIMVDNWGILPNVWIGVSVEDQKRADERIPFLLQTPSAVRFLSCEPLLGSIDLEDLAFEAAGPEWAGYNKLVDWVIVGGESGPNARPMHPDWVRSIRDQCQAAGVAFWFKQWGTWGNPSVGHIDNFVEGAQSQQWISHNGIDFNMVKIGKKRAGNLLDGQVYEEFPDDQTKKAGRNR